MNPSTQALIERYYAAFNAGDMEVFLSLLTEDVIHDINQNGREVGKPAFVEFMRRMSRCYRERIADIVIMMNADGSRAATEFTVYGEYLTTDEGLPLANGQRYRLPGGAFFAIRDGKIARVTNYYNLQDWLSQVGADQAGGLRIERCSGAALRRYIPELARLRIEVFREFPYLYDGDYDYEQNYLQTYVQSPGAVIVLALDGDHVVGASTGLPLRHEPAEVLQPFHEQGYDVERVFYFGESVLQERYRGHGIGVRFFEEREAHARALGAFDLTCFCAVERTADHPRRPSDYVPLDEFWKRRGYTRHPELSTTFVWRDLDEEQASPKPMVFWLKRL